MISLRRLILGLAVFAGVFGFGPGVESARACPMCKTANESDSALPKAYMYSILFMLAMPATVLTGFGIGFYRLSRKQDELRQAEEVTEPSTEQN